VRAQRFEHTSVIAVLVDVEDRLDLPAAVSMHKVIPVHRDGEAALAIHESDNPHWF
jgi:hypothetical protein